MSSFGLLSRVPFPILHGDPRLLDGPMWTSWRIDPTIALGLFGLIAAYLAAVGPLNRRRPGFRGRTVTGRQRTLFVAGCATLLVALGPPLEDWSELLLSGHMAQHILLTMLAPPLLLLGTPEWLLRPLLRWRLVARLGYVLTRPLVAYALAGFAFVVWHVPTLYDAALRQEPVHILEHVVYLGTAMLVWWPIVGPLPEWPRLSPGWQCLYLAAQTLPGGVVGSFITVAAPGLYAPYEEVPRMWGLGVETDQQIAGLTMWVGANTVYLLLLTVIFFRWAGQEDARARGGAVG